MFFGDVLWGELDTLGFSAPERRKTGVDGRPSSEG
jgi:hypothetical protein